MEDDAAHTDSGRETADSAVTQRSLQDPTPPLLPYMTYLEAVLLSIAFIILAIVIGSVMLGIALVLGAALGHPPRQNPVLEQPELLLPLGNVLAVIPLLLWGWWRSGQSLRDAVGLTPFRWPVMAALVPIGIGSAVLLSEFDNLMRWLIPQMPTLFSEVFEALFASPLLAFLAIVVVAPLTEELLFRGVVLRGLLRRHGRWGACIVSALLFGLIHVNPPQIIAGFFAGLLLAWVLLRTDSVWPCVWLHAVFNAVPLAAYAMHSGEIQGFTSEPEPGVFQPLWLSALGAALLVVGIVVLMVPRFAGQAAPRKGYACD